jgi:hypothetical protein
MLSRKYLTWLKKIRVVTLEDGPTVWEFHRIQFGEEQGLHPYHIQLVQGLKPEDLLKRVRFCEWLLEKNEEPQFIERLLTTDETTFTRDGIFNARNTHLGPNS